MRKWFTCLFAGLWLFAVQSATAQCSFTGFGLKIESITATQGQQVCLDVTTQNFTDILGMQFSIHYNSAILQFNNVANTNLPGLTAASFGTPSPGVITMTWNDPDLMGITRPDGTVLFELCLTATGNTTTTVSFANTPTTIEAINGDVEEITFSSCPGTVTLGGGGGTPTPLGLTIESTTATQGQQVCLDLRTQDFTNLTRVQFSLQYNSAILQFVNATNFSLAGLTAASFNNPTPGVLTMIWNAPGGTGVTRPNNTVIAELCFTVIGNTTSTVSFTNTPVATEVLNSTQQQVALNGTNGTVTVSGGGGGTNFSLNIESVTAPQGQQVCLNVATQGFTNILGMQFSIQYNSSVLSFVNVSNLNLNGLSAASFGNPSPGVITTTWNDPDGVGVTRPNGTVIFELCFTITGTTTSTVSFGNTPTTIEILNNAFQIVPFNSTSGTVTVSGGGGGGGNFSLDIESITAPQGQQVCLNVATQGFTNILGMQFSIQYNSSVLSFVNVSNLNLNGLSAASFGNPSPGVITMTWNDPDVVGVTRPNGTVIFELCFTITGTTTSTVSFSNTPTSIEILNSSLQEVSFNSTSGTVTVSGGGGGEPSTCNITGFGLEIESANGTQGQQVCLEVRTHGFNDVLGMQFSINYNASALTFVNIAALNLNGLSAASFGTPTPGTITMTWNDPDVMGVTRPDGTVIFELCFNVTGNTTSMVTFGNTPTSIEILDGDLNELPFSSCAGTVTLGGGGGGPTTCNITGFGLEIEDANGTQGQQVCLEVRTHGFNDVLGMQFSINYNASVLTFVNIAALNLNGLSAASFGTPTPGTITMTWNDPDVMGVTRPDGTVIFELCFNVTGNTTSTVTFGDTPTSIEILDGDLNELPFSSCSGTVTLGTIVDPPPTPCDITGFGLEIEDANGTQGQQVCLEVRTHGFNDVLGMQFSINYNASVLTFLNVAALNLNGLSAASFGTPTPGTITMTWNDPDVLGVTRPDGTVIFELCFNVTGNTTSTVTFGNTPTSIEILDGDLNELPFSSCSGTVTLDGDPPPPPTCDITGFGLEIESINTTQPESICLEVRVHGFNDILGMQFSINYNPAILQFTGTSGFNLAGLVANSFGNPTPGVITMTWNDQEVMGITLPDGTVIFELCFTMLSCATSTVTFGNTPTLIEILNGDLDELTFSSCPGIVSCGEDPGDDIVTITNATITNVACRGLSTGAITVQATSAGGGTLTYAWSALPNPGNTPTITGRPAGTYSVTVTSSLGGSATATYMITQPATAVTINSVNVTHISCAGENDGSILVNASGGTGTLSYAWSSPPPNPGNTPNPMNLIPFSFYRVTVTDASGCTAMSMLLEVEDATPLVVTATNIQNVLCAGASTGSVTLGVTGGTGPYTYNWSGTAPDTNPTTGLTAGVYSVTVTDSRNCTQTLNNITVVALNPALTITNTAITDLNDGNPGAVNITVQGGNGTYTYVWTGPGGFSASTQDISNLTVGGQYCVTVTDGNGCTTNTCATVGEDLAITAFNINKACFGTNNGGVDITVAGGTPPYTYQWRNSSNMVIAATQDITNVAPGTYNVTVTDNNTNTVTGSFEVTSLPQITIAANIGSATSGNNGSIALNITGGAPGYTVQWGHGPTTPTINNLATGQYCATITDANLCTATGCYMVTAQPFAFGTITPTNVLCNGESTGALAVTVLGGSPPYTLTITGMPPQTSATGVFNITGLGANNWAFTVTDNAGAQISNSAEITQPSAITATSIVNNDTEDAGCTGSITLNISNGTPGYTVTWNVASTGPQIISLCAGNYVPTIEDNNGCLVTLPAIALNTFSEDAVSANVDCPTDEDGSIDLTVTGGNAPYTYEWKNAGGVVVSDDEDLTNATAGTYTVRITDASGLVLVRQYTVTAQSNFSVSAQVTSNHGNFAVSCADGTDGSAIANITGQGDFDVVWESNGNTFVGTNLQNAGPGDYTITVTDALGCEITSSLTLNAPPAITLNANVTEISCLGDKNGEIQVFAFGGVAGNYQYEWSTGIFGNLVRNLGTGNYTVTATDLNGCEKVETYTMAEPTPITVEFEIEPATEGFNGTIRAIVSGGQMPYRYEWVNLNASEFTSIVSSLAPGEYFLIVTDDNGCQSTTLSAIVPDERYPCLEERVVITPDGNGANDEFIIFCIGDLPNNNLEIYNRWGQLVFEAENYDNTWAGTSQNGTPLPDGPYYYVLEYTNPDGTPVQAKGSLTIVRE